MTGAGCRVLSRLCCILMQHKHMAIYGKFFSEKSGHSNNPQFKNWTTLVVVTQVGKMLYFGTLK